MKRTLSILLALMLLTCCAGAAAEVKVNVPADYAWPAIGTADSPVEIKVVIKDYYADSNENIELFSRISAAMAAHGQYVKLTLIDPPVGTYASPLPLLVRNGDGEADLIYFQGGDQSIADEGLLVDLTPYVKNSYFVKNLMNPVNTQRTKNYPYLLWLAATVSPVPQIRKDWAAKLTTYSALMENPTVENWHALMTELKQSGLCQSVITMTGDLARIDTIFNHAFGITSTVMKEGDRWIFSQASQGTKEKLAFYAQLYEEGIIDSEWVTDKWNTMEQKFYTGTTAIISGNPGGSVQTYDIKTRAANGEQAQLTSLPPASGVSQGYTSIDTTKESRGFGINVDCKNYDAAFAVLEFMASPEGRVLDQLGVEGINFYTEDDTVYFVDGENSFYARFWSTKEKFPAEVKLSVPLFTEAAQESMDIMNKYMMLDTNIIIPDSMAANWDAMINLYKEYSTDIVNGTKDISAFDEFLTKWNAAGGDLFADYLAGIME